MVDKRIDSYVVHSRKRFCQYICTYSKRTIMSDLTESNSEMNDPQSIKMYQDLPEIVVTNGGVVKNGIEEDIKIGKMY